MVGDLRSGMSDAHHPVSHLHRHLGADQPPRHAVMVGVKIDAAVTLDPPRHHTKLTERRPAIDFLESLGLVAAEALDRRLTGGAVNTAIGDLAHPPGKMGLQPGP